MVRVRRSKPSPSACPRHGAQASKSPGKSHPPRRARPKSAPAAADPPPAESARRPNDRRVNVLAQSAPAHPRVRCSGKEHGQHPSVRCRLMQSAPLPSAVHRRVLRRRRRLHERKVRGAVLPPQRKPHGRGRRLSSCYPVLSLLGGGGVRGELAINMYLHRSRMAAMVDQAESNHSPPRTHSTPPPPPRRH